MTFRAPVRAAGLKAALKTLVHRKYRNVQAVQDVSLSLEPGEVVGFIGPNGAGKTTTMKILSGLLHPTSGSVEVLGFVPWQRRPAYLRRIALIRGSQPIGTQAELTVMDVLRYQQLLYDVGESNFKANVKELTELLEMEPLLERQLRALSLGERMRAGLAMALVYRPEILFLDEPTLGLDVSASATVRRFILSYGKKTGATVLLTSHYMADVQSLCPRLVLIDKGTVHYDGPLEELSARLSPYKLLRLKAPELDRARAAGFGEVVESEEGVVVLRVPRDDVPKTTARVLSEIDVTDLSVEEPPLESVIDRAYREGVSAS